MSKKPKGLEQTYQVRLYPTLEQGRLLMEHCQEYISTVNVLASALDADVIPHEDFSTKDFVAALPSCLKNQALRDARSIFKRSLELDTLPVLKKPICQWNNQNWQIEQGRLTLPVCLDGKIKQIKIACADVELPGLPGLLRIKKKRGKWIADVTMTQAKPEPFSEEGIMGIDLGIKVPAVAHINWQGHHTYKWWGKSPQKQPYEKYLELLPIDDVPRLQSRTARHQGRAGRPCLYLARMPCL
jgi:putative transposase